MAPRKARPAVTAKEPSSATRVTRSKAKKNESTKASTSTTATGPASTYRMKRYRNGMLNLKKTPDHLVAVVQCNADSPLLRLPAEIRNQIWSLAMGGQLVLLPDFNNTKGCALSKDALQVVESKGYKFYGWDHKLKTVKRLAAFHLPEVCRQIYSETVLTSYKENTFLYGYSQIYPRNSMIRLMAAQRRAITRIQMGWLVPSLLLENGHISSLTRMRSMFPNLKTISVPAVVLNRVTLGQSITLGQSRNMFETDHLSAGLKERLGEHVEIIFEAD